MAAFFRRGGTWRACAFTSAALVLVCFAGTARGESPEPEAVPGSGWSAGRPVTVIAGEDLFATGYPDLGRALAALVPAFRFNSPLAVNGDDHVRTGTLRGLAPDHLVVLVNGRRQHTSARFYTNDQPGRGSVGVDLGLLPMAAVKRVEVLSGGAGGRHGSGALAGVINIVLDDTSEGGQLHGTFGQQRSAIEGVPRLMGVSADDATETITLGLSGALTEDDGDGDDLTLHGSWGFDLGEGFMRISAEYQDREATNRAGYDPRQQYPLRPDGSFDVRELTVDRRNAAYGNPAMEELNILFNAAVPLTGAVEVYGFTFLGTRNSESAAPFVRPVDPVNVPALYPDGFLPDIRSDIDDRSFTVGVRGERWGWNWDASFNQREDEIDLSLGNSLNPTFGAGSPTSFVVGNNEYQLAGLELTLRRAWQPPVMAGPLALELGVKSYSEEYEIESGDPAAAFDAGRVASPQAPIPAASVGFPGFALEVETSRDSFSAHAAVNGRVIERLELSAAVRMDDLEDLGTQVSVDLGGELRLTPALLVRAAGGSAYHAPSLAQSTFTQPLTTLTVSGERRSGIRTPTSPAARALGAGELEEQPAVHGSLGVHYQPWPDLELSVDVWQVSLDDRVVLSQTLSGGAAARALEAAGLGDTDSVQIAVNGVDTRTRGVDAHAGYGFDLMSGRLDLSVGLSRHQTRVEDAHPLTTSLGETLTPFGDRAQAQLEDAQPVLKLITRARWQRGPLDLQARVTRLGEVTDHGLGGGEPLAMDAVWLTDLDLRYRVNPRLTFGVGIHNLLNEYPDAHPVGTGEPVRGSLYPFSGYSAFDPNGRLMYGRVTARFD